MDPLVDLRGVLAASKVHEHTAAPEVGLHEVEADLRQVRASIWEKRLVVFKDDDWLVPVPALRFSHRPEVRDAAGHPVGLNCSLGPHVGLDETGPRNAPNGFIVREVRRVRPQRCVHIK